MKVLSYLASIMEGGDYCLKLKKYIGIPRKENFLDTLADFYSQPFKPELITELFEPIEYHVWIDLPIINTYERKYALETYWDDEYKKPLFIDFARTLDEFITDCQRAGIELKWREKQ